MQQTPPELEALAALLGMGRQIGKFEGSSGQRTSLAVDPHTILKQAAISLPAIRAGAEVPQPVPAVAYPPQVQGMPMSQPLYDNPILPVGPIPITPQAPPFPVPNTNALEAFLRVLDDISTNIRTIAQILTEATKESE